MHSWLFIHECPKKFFEKASIDLRDDKELAIIGNTDCKEIKYLSDRLKDDKELITLSVSKNYHVLEDTSDRLKADRDIVIQH